MTAARAVPTAPPESAPAAEADASVRDYVTAAEAARRLGVARAAATALLRTTARSGRIHLFWRTNRYEYRWDEVTALCAASLADRASAITAARPAGRTPADTGTARRISGERVRQTIALARTPGPLDVARTDTGR